VDILKAAQAEPADNQVGVEPEQLAEAPAVPPIAASAGWRRDSGPKVDERGEVAAPGQLRVGHSENPAEVGASPAGVGRLPYYFPVDPLGLLWPHAGRDY